jgi:hypothetical protein
MSVISTRVAGADPSSFETPASPAPHDEGIGISAQPPPLSEPPAQAGESKDEAAHQAVSASFDVEADSTLRHDSF